MMRLSLLSGAAIALTPLLATTALHAQTAAAPGAPSRLAAAFGARERVSDASLSPDGTKVAFVSPGPAQSTIVQVLDLKTGSAKPVNYANGDPMTLSSCGWASNDRLVCTLYGISDREGGWIAYSRLVALNADGSDVLPLGVMQRTQDYVSRSDGSVIDWRVGTSPRVLLQRNYVPLKSNITTVGSKLQGLGVDLLDTTTGKVDHIESADPVVGNYIADGQGNIRMKVQYESFRFGYTDDGRRTYYYRVAGNRDWKPFGVYNASTDQGMFPLAVDGAANVAYVLEKTAGRDVLYRVALDGSMKKDVAFADDKVDIDRIVRVGRHGRVVGASFSREKREVEYFDAEYRTLLGRLHKALPQLPQISILDSSADEKKHLVYAASDTDAGRYFLYDSATRALSPLGQVRPELAGMPLGTVKPITYTAADGTAVPGYLTLPRDRKDGEKIAAIVMPHGGPAARDEWGFDWLAQFFVARGYAVLQPNYRGSSGYGQDWFQDNGFRSWKTAIGDVNDAGRWLVKEGIADPKKLAIVGWSYGGYAALQSNVVDPGLFKAVVAIAPVTDLGLLRGEWGTDGNKVARDYIGDGPHVAEGSPLRHASAFQVPVMMFHGTKDINVAVNESRLMDKALAKAGKKSELIVYPKIDHQLSDSTVRTDMLTRADAFLTKTLGQ